MPRQSSQKPSGGGSPRKKSGGKKEPDAVEILKADHEKVLTLFKQYPSAAPQERESIAKQIFSELDIHAAIEEELFYPALREQADPKELGELELDETDTLDAEAISEEAELDEDEDVEREEETDVEAVIPDQEAEEEGEDLITLSYEDHKAMKELIQELRQLDSSSDQYRDRFMELQEAVTDHVGEEEEVLFAEAKLKLDTKKLGAEIIKRRSDLASSMAA